MKRQPTSEMVRLLVADQRADGTFASYSAPLGDPFGAQATQYQTTFMVALIVEALAEVNDARLEPVRRRAADWLLTQQGPQWSFNYWAREAAEATSKPYPDDWDDTSCALAALMRVRPEAVTGEVMGHIVTLLTNTEMAEGGPYRTWIVTEEAPKHWHDVDVAVNANIGYMLKLQGVDLPSLEQLVDERIAAHELQSPYYPGPGPVEYFVSRWYQGARRGELRAHIAGRRQGGHWGTALSTALAVSALLNLGAEPKEVSEAVAWLRTLTGDEVRAEAFCMDPAIEGVKYVAGSRALTAALCLEAMAKYDAAVPAASRGAKEAGVEEAVHEQVMAQVIARLEGCGDEIAAGARHVRDELLSGTAAGQITLLPYLFRQALGARGRTVSDERVVALGVISLYGWLAYTIYDDFLDEEGQPPLLPVANIALRELTLALHEEADRLPGFGEMAAAVLDRQEAANAWEVTHCRERRQSGLIQRAAPDFGDLRVLAERSMGHALGGLALTLELGYAPDGAEVQQVRKFFHNFLIARQLSDDIHDWKDDLSRGQINAVGAHLLRGLGRREATVKGLYNQLERYFWERGARELNAQIDGALKRARAALKQAAFIQRPEVLEALLTPIEDSARKAESQQRQTAEFLQSYRPEG
jgi:hypothetical protein